jgi:hypothetical protein
LRRPWRHPLLGLLLLALLLDASRATAGLCLPPLLGGRPRLHEVGRLHVMWLDLLMREHEVCWREPAVPNEARIFALGNSTIFGFPLPADRTAIGLVDRRFANRGIPAHVFNLGFVFTYQLKELLILSKALPYEPDLIVYGVTLDDFLHRAPLEYASMKEFFEANSGTIERLAADPPATFAEPLERYREAQARTVRPIAPWIALRQTGSFVRRYVAEFAMALRKRMFPDLPDENALIQKPNPHYSCETVKRDFEKNFSDWKAWSMLDALAELRDERGIDVLVVNWPVAHVPRGDCYNIRYPAAALADYAVWMKERTAALDLPYLDLHDLLLPSEFVDSLHPTAHGQAKVAARLAVRLEAWLAERAER